MPAAAWAVPAAVGALGLYNGNKQASAARNAGNAALAPQLAAQKQMLALAQGYDPAAEDQRAIAMSNQNGAQVLKKSLSDLSGDFAASGGQPTGDTAFNIGATNTANRVIDPLRAAQMQMLSTESERKANMLNRVFSAPAGQLASNYFNLAAGAQGDAMNSLGVFADALKNFPWAHAQIAAAPSGYQSYQTSGLPYGNDPLLSGMPV